VRQTDASSPWRRPCPPGIRVDASCRQIFMSASTRPSTGGCEGTDRRGRLGVATMAGGRLLATEPFQTLRERNRTCTVAPFRQHLHLCVFLTHSPNIHTIMGVSFSCSRSTTVRRRRRRFAGVRSSVSSASSLAFCFATAFCACMRRRHPRGADRRFSRGIATPQIREIHRPS